MGDKPRPRPKPGQAKPTFWLLAWLGILQSPSRLKPGQSRGFQAKPEPAHHYFHLMKPGLSSFRKLCQTSCGRRCWGLLLQPKFLKVKRTSETCLWRAWVSSSHLQVLWPLNSTVVQHMDTSTCIHIFPHNHYRQGWASRLVPRYFFHFFVQVALLNE